jgi:hypothetical protein
MDKICDCASARNRLPEPSPDRALRRDLALLKARYDSSGLSPAIYTAIRELETDIPWIEHERGRS